MKQDFHPFLCNSGPTLPQKMSAFGLLTNGVDGVLAVGGWSPDRSTRLNEMWELKCVSDDSCIGKSNFQFKISPLEGSHLKDS